MSDDDESCLVQKLSHYIDLNESSRAQLARLEEDEQEFDARRDIQMSGGRHDRLYVVKHGWLYSYADLPNGRRQIIRVHHPGDILGFPDIAFEENATGLRACEPVCLCPFPKSALTAVFSDCPQLSALLFVMAARDQTIVIDRMRALGRMNAREKIADLLLDLICRLRITNSQMTDTMRLPLSQFEIADAVGLTNVYVSKTLNALENDGLIERMEGRIRIIEEPALRRMVDFKNRYEEMDLSWLP